MKRILNKILCFFGFHDPEEILVSIKMIGYVNSIDRISILKNICKHCGAHKHGQ